MSSLQKRILLEQDAFRAALFKLIHGQVRETLRAHADWQLPEHAVKSLTNNRTCRCRLGAIVGVEVTDCGQTFLPEKSPEPDFQFPVTDSQHSEKGGSSSNSSNDHRFLTARERRQLSTPLAWLLRNTEKTPDMKKPKKEVFNVLLHMIKEAAASGNIERRNALVEAQDKIKKVFK